MRAADVMEDQRQPAAARAFRAGDQSLQVLQGPRAVHLARGPDAHGRGRGDALGDGAARAAAVAQAGGQPGAVEAAASHDRLGAAVGGPAGVGERGDPESPPGEDDPAHAGLPPGLGGGDPGQFQVGDGVRADLVPLRREPVQLGQGQVAGRADRAGDDVERARQVVAVQDPGRRGLVGVPVVEGEADHGPPGGRRPGATRGSHCPGGGRPGGPGRAVRAGGLGPGGGAARHRGRCRQRRCRQQRCRQQCRQAGRRGRARARRAAPGAAQPPAWPSCLAHRPPRGITRFQPPPRPLTC